MRTKKTSKIWSWTSSPAAKKLFVTSRMLHLYVSAALFSLLIFFCVTGITLNHIDWLSSGEEYSIPAGYAFATWYIYQGTVEVEYQKGSIIAIMNDLHKGRHTGKYWRWLIDISAVFMLLFSLTGLIILFQQLKRR